MITEGTWEVSFRACPVIVVEVADDCEDIIANIDLPMGGNKDAKDNAHLIAASKELLAACKMAFKRDPIHCYCEDDSKCLRCTLSEAIAKAEGKS
jgi:hypothetical protein